MKTYWAKVPRYVTPDNVNVLRRKPSGKASQVCYANERTSLGKGSQHMFHTMILYVMFYYGFLARCINMYMQLNEIVHMYTVIAGLHMML
jgi:hypothetical protein